MYNDKRSERTLDEFTPRFIVDFVSDLQKETVISKSHAYVDHGAVLIKTPWCASEELVWYICDTGSSDMDAALAELEKQEETRVDKIAICARECEGVHCLVFSGEGKPYEDRAVRTVSETDAEQMAELTTVGSHDDMFTKSISQNMDHDFSRMKRDDAVQVLGLWVKDTLVGAVSVKDKNQGEVAVIGNVFVAQKYRSCGYAVRLVRAALALYPGRRYSYSCGSDNPASIATAKSAGFVFEGTYIF